MFGGKNNSSELKDMNLIINFLKRLYDTKGIFVSFSIKFGGVFGNNKQKH
jgi:hypothetical protein